MNLLLAITVGALFATGFYLSMSKKILQIVFGFLILSQAVNFLIFLAGGLTSGVAPFIGEDTQAMAEPLSQALILTAIVIGFAATAFIVVLGRFVYQAHGTDETQHLKKAEEV
jgi:multisubunit Na+/H+ antiporter MnhC subunit